MPQGRICIFGGTGFVGHHLIPHLARQNWHISVPSRHPQRHRDLLIHPGLELIKTDRLDDNNLKQLVAGCDVVINLVGILNEYPGRGQTFRQVHVELTRRIIQACKTAAVPRLLHMSALGADAGRGASIYLRTKGEAENLVHQAECAAMHVTSFRPSVIFGPGDSFINRFAGLLRLSPVLPLACANARFAPVYVEDVTRVFVRAIQNKTTYGKRYELCGPHEYSLRELVSYVAQVTGKQRLIIGLGHSLSRLQASLLQFAPGKPFTPDNFRSLTQDSICSGPFPATFNITPTPLEAVVPTYLSNSTVRGRYARYRGSYSDFS
jgi:NADH dehydrogenase